MASISTSWVNGRTEQTSWTNMGHGSSSDYNDAVYSMVITAPEYATITGLTVYTSWNNLAPPTDTGWGTALQYVCVLSNDSGASISAYNTSNYIARAYDTSLRVSPAYGQSGTLTFNLSGFSITPGTTYYLRFNFNGLTNSTMKTLSKTSALSIAITGSTPSNTAPYWGSAVFTTLGSTTIRPPSDGGYTITWQPATDPEGQTLTYYVNRSVNAGDYVLLNAGGQTSTSFYQTFSGYNRGEYFSYAISVSDPYGAGCSDKWYLSSSLLGINILPTAPSSVSLNYSGRVLSTLSSVTVSWNGGSSGNYEQTAYYDVYRYVNGVGTRIIQNTTATSYVDSDFGAATGPNDSVYYVVQTYDGQEYSTTATSSATLVVNSVPGQPGAISPAATTTQATTIGNSISLSWAESSDAQGDPVSYHVQYRTASTAAGLTGGWTTLTGTRVAAGPYVHDTTVIPEGYFFQYNIIPFDGYEEGTPRVSPIYQRNVKPSAVTGVTRVSAAVIVAATAININWDLATSHTLPSSGISIANSVTNIQYATSINGTTWGSWQNLNSPAITDGVDETFSSPVYVSTFGLGRGHYVKFQFQVQDALGFTSSTWVESPTTKYNTLPNAVTSIYPTSTGVTIYPNAVAYTNSSFAIVGGGDPDAQQTYYYIDIGINANGTQTQTWTNIANWVAAGSPNFDYTAIRVLENLALNYSATNCQIRVKVRDTLNEETGYYYSAVFTVDYRDAPSNVSAPTLTPSTWANGKTNRINPGATITLTWSNPADRNTGESFTFQVYTSTDGGAYSQNPGNNPSGYVYTVPANTGNDKTIAFKIVATDSQGLTSVLATTSASTTITICRLVAPSITLVTAARSGGVNKNLTVTLYSSDTGGSRPISGSNDTDFFNSWDSKNNLSGPFTYGIQYANNPSFTGATTHSAIDDSGLLFTNPAGQTYSVSATSADVPPFVYSTLTYTGGTAKSYTTVAEVLVPTSSYYVRAYITVNGTTVYSTALYIKEVFPTMSFKKYQIGINTGTPQNSTTHAALSVYGIPTMISGDTIIDVGAGGAVNEAYIGFRANTAAPNTVSGKLGCGTDGVLKWGTYTVYHTGNYSGPTGLTAGSASVGYLNYNGTTSTAGQLYGGTTTPTGTTRLNYGGYFYPTALNMVGQADTVTAATHYFVETGTDGFVRPKLLADVKTEIVTKAAIEAVLTGAISTHTHGYLPLTGSTMTGPLFGDSVLDYDAAAITGVTGAPFDLVNASVGTTAAFLPFGHMMGVHNSGYQTHLVFGLYKTATAWTGSGMFVGLGGADANPTEYFLLEYGGTLKHSSGSVTVNSNQINSTGWLRVQSPSGYIDIGPANTEYGHIYTDRPEFYFNKGILVNGTAVSLSGHTHDYVPTSASCNKNWYWSGQSGQPPWLWGGSDGSNFYTYNPSNFSVNYASSAGTVSGYKVAKGTGTTSATAGTNTYHSFGITFATIPSVVVQHTVLGTSWTSRVGSISTTGFYVDCAGTSIPFCWIAVG